MCNDHLQRIGTVLDVGYISVIKEIMSLLSRDLHSCGRRHTNVSGTDECYEEKQRKDAEIKSV